MHPPRDHRAIASRRDVSGRDESPHRRPTAILLAAGACIVLLAAAAPAEEPPTLRLGSDEWPPFTGSPGAPRAANELVDTALERAGFSAETAISGWEEVEAGIRRGELDGSAAIWRTERRERDLLFSLPYLENRLVLIGRAGSDVSAASLTELAGKRVAVVGQYAYGAVVDDAQGVYFVHAHSDQDSLDKLLAGAVDYMLVDELVVRHLMAFQPDEAAANLEIGLNPLARRTLHFALRKDLPGADRIIAAFDAEIREMQADGTYGRILQVGWIRADVDGDGLYELVPLGEQLGELPPRSVYDVYGTAPADETPEKERIVVQGNIYKGWDAIPDRFKIPPSQGGDTSFKYGTTVVTFKF
ncbi:MAG: transporter substrate-binding domain-containing protein [Thermoanaerobaculales bacterium]|jgi:ABC-type amino acid transport substrate-binding protein|nr:transporter substrate-binding domain-containing protein [Thermoanaerobaculales bacterium]